MTLHSARPATNDRRLSPGGADIVDAEFEMIDPAPPPSAPVAGPGARAPAPAGLDMLRAVGPRDRPRTRLHVLGLATLGGLALIAVAVHLGGHQAAVAPSLPTLAGQTTGALALASLESRHEVSGVRDLLRVRGEAINLGRHPARIEGVLIEAHGRQGRLLVDHFLGTDGVVLPPGGRLSFSSRLATPGHRVTSVSVSARAAADHAGR